MPAATPARLTMQPSPAASGLAGRLVLYSGDVRRSAILQQPLDAAGFLVTPVHSFQELCQALQSNAATDMILLELGSHPRHIFPWIEQLTARPSSGVPPINPSDAAILVIADATHSGDAVRAVSLGAYDSLLWPAPEELLLAAVRRAVEFHQLRAQNNLFRNHLEQLIAARTRMLQNTMQQLEQSYDVTLEALGNALDLKDAETEGHSKRVTAYTLALGRAVGLDGEQLRVVGRGAFLHDIGKMAIPDAILRKPGRLTEEERAIMRTHSERGYRMILKIPFLREAAEIVYAHQECYDGSGYPRGLRGEEIHIGARIFAIADTVDAITSNRPYRRANTLAFARKEVLRCAGTQFDPAIVDVFLATPDAIWQNLRDGIMQDGTDFSPFGYTFGDGKQT